MNEMNADTSAAKDAKSQNETPWHLMMKAMAMHGKCIDVAFALRPHFTPASLLHEWNFPHQRDASFMQRQGARMMLMGLFDYLCQVSPEARQAALDLGFKPVFEQAQREADHV